MKKMMLLAVAAIGTIGAVPATAGVLTTSPGSTATFAAPTAPGNVVIDFNSSTLPAGFARIGGSLLTGDSASGAEPAFSDHSQYLGILGGNSATISSSTSGFDAVSFFLGSIDSYNSVDILSTTGSVIASFTGSMFTPTANGDQDLPSTNRRITFTRDVGDSSIGGVRFSSGLNSAEVDNLVFAVPELSTWAMMLLGFGLMGLSMRARRRRPTLVYA